MAKREDQEPGLFARAYPRIAEWVLGGGYVEIGYTDGYTRAFVRALDEGGMVYEGKSKYPSLDAALQDLDAGIATWIGDNQ